MLCKLEVYGRNYTVMIAFTLKIIEAIVTQKIVGDIALLHKHYRAQEISICDQRQRMEQGRLVVIPLVLLRRYVTDGRGDGIEGKLRYSIQRNSRGEGNLFE